MAREYVSPLRKISLPERGKTCRGQSCEGVVRWHDWVQSNGHQTSTVELGIFVSLRLHSLVYDALHSLRYGHDIGILTCEAQRAGGPPCSRLFSDLAERARGIREKRRRGRIPCKAHTRPGIHQYMYMWTLTQSFRSSVHQELSWQCVNVLPIPQGCFIFSVYDRRESREQVALRKKAKVIPLASPPPQSAVPRRSFTDPPPMFRFPTHPGRAWGC